MMIINPYAFAASAPTDPYFSTRKLLLHFDGSNGATTTTDSSSNARTVNNNSTATLSSAQQVFGPTSSTIASADHWYVADHADWAVGSGMFTMEARVFFSSGPSGGGVHAFFAQWATFNRSFFFGFVTGTLSFLYSTDGAGYSTVSAPWSPSANQWYSIAADRDASNVMRLYINGSVVASQTVSSTLYDSTAPLRVGGSSTDTGYSGFMDEARFTKGRAEYGGAYTPALSPFPDA